MRSIARYLLISAVLIPSLATAPVFGCSPHAGGVESTLLVIGENGEHGTYPDVSMVCGPIEYDPEDATHTTITNPVLVLEVLSVTTEKGDRGNKWIHYQRIASLQEYVLVSQEPRIEIYRRTSSGTWEYFEVREGAVRLASGPTLDLSMLYSDLPV